MYHIIGNYPLLLSSTHKYNRIKYYKTINVAFIILSDGDFPIPLFSNTVLAILDKIMYRFKRTYKELYSL